MSYAVRRPADPLRSSGAADTPTTATVLDYMCLFTHDLRRKQKRWQDGRLKFHTFNKRVMVYDDRGNFIGDSHWHSSDALDEGDELELDRGSAIVQVADCTGSREQDLTELLDKRAKEVGQRRASAAARTTPAQQTPVRRHEGQQRQPQTHFQLKHRPLSAIVPSPGPIGRAAIPARSPFEARLAEAGGEQQQPPVAKRRRVCVSPPSKKGFAQSLFGAKLTLSACPTATPPATVRVSKKLPGTGRLPESHEIAENEDDDVVMLDGPPLGPRNMAAKPAQLRAGSAKVMPAATLQVKPWRSPRAGGANVDTGEKDTSRHAEPDALPSSHLDNARPAAPARAMEQERADKRLKAAKPTNEIRQDVFQTSIAHDVREAASPCSMQEGTDEVPLTKSKAPAERTQETSLPSFAREQPLAPQKAEPRTELRIRPRQRRGLLMMSAKHAHPRDAHARPPSRPASTRPSPKASPRLGPLELGSPFEAPEAQDAIWSGSEASASCHAAPDLADSSSQNDVALIDAIRRRRVASIDAESSSDDEVLDQRQRANSRRVPESDDDGSEGQEEHPSRARGGERRRTRCTSGDEPDSSPEPPARKSTRRSCRRIKNTEQKAENPAPSRPRITKMARKSVRSREIIGYIPPVEDDMVPALFAASARRNALWANPVLSVGSTCASAPPAVIAERGGEAKARPRGNVAPLPLALEPDREEADPETKPDANVEAAAMPAIAPLKKPVGTMTPEEAPPKEPTKASMPAAEPPKELAGVTMAEPASPGREAAQGQGPNRNPDADNGPRPRMSNPATRGKKATRKEDAAGHPLQNLVPMEPAAPARAAPAPTVEPKRPESVLPGFSRANGGAWSKHAEDLLGMTRPTERTRGR